MLKVILLILVLLVSPVSLAKDTFIYSDVLEIGWVTPTTKVDGSSLLASEIIMYEMYYECDTGRKGLIPLDGKLTHFDLGKRVLGNCLIRMRTKTKTFGPWSEDYLLYVKLPKPTNEDLSNGENCIEGYVVE